MLVQFLNLAASPAAILISAFGAWWFASKAIAANKETTRKKATFDYLTHIGWDADYIQAKKTFLALHKGPKRLSAYSEEYAAAKTNLSLSDEERNEIISNYSAISNLLNEYENMAIAIKMNALDEGMMKLAIRQQIIRHIEASRDFIKHTRNNSSFDDPSKIWCEIEALAKSWEQSM